MNPSPKDLPYPHAPTRKDKERKYARFLEICKRLQVNAPFLEALEQITAYAKFIKSFSPRKDSLSKIQVNCRPDVVHFS